MSLITPSDFVVELFIPATTEPATEQGVQAFIDKYQPLFFKLLFGDEMGALFTAELAVDPPITSGRWFDLAQNADLKQALRCFVYWYYWRNNVSYSSPMGEKKGQSQNSTNIAMNHKTVDRWNEMVDLNRSLANDLDTAVYPEFSLPYWRGCSFYGSRVSEVYVYVNTLNI